MSVNCDMIRDLADVYESGKASAETCRIVEEHLGECSSCRKYFEQRRARKVPRFRIEMSGNEDEQIAEHLRRLSKRLQTRHTVNAVFAVAAAIFGFAAILYDLLRRSDKH